MSIFNWLNRNKEITENYEQTEEGKKLYEQFYLNSLKAAEWEKNTPPDIKRKVKVLEILVSVFLIGYTVILHIGFMKGNELWVLLGESLITVICFTLFLIKPKFIKWRCCLMMPIIAFACITLIYIYMGINLGFNPKLRRQAAKEEYQNEITDDFLKEFEPVINFENSVIDDDIDVIDEVE